MRPKIGVALGSGAVRGWAQIGVFEGLAALGVVPQVVSGTSIGALVGAAFVTGKLGALKGRMENFSRRDVATMLDVRLTSGGLIEGRRVETFLDSLGIVGSIETQGPHYAAVGFALAFLVTAAMKAEAVANAVSVPHAVDLAPFGANSTVFSP